MSDKKELQFAKQVKRNIQKGFGKKVCKELHLDCASCKAQVLVGHLNWYIDLLEWSIGQDKKPRRQKTKTSEPLPRGAEALKLNHRSISI